MVIDGVDYGLYQPNIFGYLRDGAGAIGVAPEEWFRTAVAAAYDQIAFSHGCNIRMSADRTDEARLFWARDIGRLEIHGDTVPDHFKQAGFLAYWLRRRIVVQHVSRAIAFDHDEDQHRQTQFVMMSNEFCAFVLGFRICVFFVYGHLADEGDDIAADLERIQVEPSLLFDIAALMKNKNVSPHSLYTVFRSLFYNLELPKRRNVKLLRG